MKEGMLKDRKFTIVKSNRDIDDKATKKMTK